MKEKRIFYRELAYVVGIFVLALGTVFMEKADFGMSMVVAPAVSQFLPFFSFGMSEYVFQALLLVVLSVVMRKVKRSYLLSFVTAFVYGVVLDAVMHLLPLTQLQGIGWQIVLYILGLVTCSLGIAFLFHTYFPPEAYELFVKELAQTYHWTISKTKTVYDCCSCILGVILSWCFFGTFVGVKLGTVRCALVNGWLFGRISGFLGKKFEFRDAFPWEKQLNG